jgi:hypothetical protein
MSVKGILLVFGFAGGLLLSTPAQAAATLPLPEPSVGPPPFVQRVEVPVPTDDGAAQLLQMHVAAAVGALAGGMFTAVRMRRRWAATRPGGTPGLIELSAGDGAPPS